MTNEKEAGAESVTELHARWSRILDRLDTVPGLPTPKREARLEEAGRLEREIARTPASGADEIVLKLRMVLTGRTTALSEPALIAGVIEDVGRTDE